MADFRIINSSESEYVFNNLEKISFTLEFLMTCFEYADKCNKDFSSYHSVIGDILTSQSHLAYSLSLLFKPDKDIYAANELIKEIELMNRNFRQSE